MLLAVLLLSAPPVCQAVTINPDNIVIAHGNRSAEYTRSGTLVQTITVDTPLSGFNSFRGLVVSVGGKLHVLNEAAPMKLSTNTLGTSTWRHDAPADGMNLAGVTYYGGIGADSRYVYVPDRSNNINDVAGIVRFSINDPGSSERFAVGANFHAVKVGLDGRVYGLNRDGDLWAYNPVTLVREDTFAVFAG
ncbi:MAG: hypothetical protein MI741_06555, partial [Rhodospirillales bacterium]|nr:hypothetical protein [Rhodospirillales bacterium]